MSMMKTENGRHYANCPTGAEYLSQEGKFLKRIGDDWYYWCNYHETWRHGLRNGVLCYKLEKVE